MITVVLIYINFGWFGDIAAEFIYNKKYDKILDIYFMGEHKDFVKFKYRNEKNIECTSSIVYDNYLWCSYKYKYKNKKYTKIRIYNILIDQEYVINVYNNNSKGRYFVKRYNQLFFIENQI